MRITGLSGSGLDIDSIVKDSMKSYKIRVDQTTQKKDVLGVKQKLYRDILSDSKKFYDKYFELGKSDSLLKSSNYKSVEFTSSNEDVVTVTAGSEAKAGDYTVTGTKATAAKAVLKITDLVDKPGESTFRQIEINTKMFYIEKVSSEKAMAEDLNNQLKNQKMNITARYSDFAGTNQSGLILESSVLGGDSTINTTFTNITAATVTPGKNADITIKDINGGECTLKGNTNTATLDGITFTVTGEIPALGAKVTGKKDVTGLKDKVIGFINDYNTLIEKLNTTTMTRHDRSYSPLTAEQKKDMSESEIKLWNEKVETGQLNRDYDITRIANSMKETMRTVMEGTGFNLGKIGIKPIKDYSGTKNGTFTIEEDILKTALEDNTEDVMKLFITDSSTEKGILYKLKNTLKDEMMSSTSVLAKKVGIEGTASFYNNDLTKSISTYEEKIKKMQKDLTKREQYLYSKYATLETMMNKYNSQQAAMSSQFGQQ